MNNNIFFCSDHHFGHENIIKYCSRPYATVHEMNKDLIDRHNSVVGKDDIVYHLGDFTFNDPQRYLQYMNGHIFLIRGNHDKKKFYNSFIGSMRWMSIEIDGKKCFLNHYPITPENEKKTQDYYNFAKKHDFYIVGHVHEKWKTLGNNINVGVDVWDYYPIGETQLIKAMK
jgi:calcineurin-like phosphoesterase family protein